MVRMKSIFPFAIPTSGTFWRYQRALTTVPQEIWNFERFRSLLLLLYAGRCCFCRLHRRNSQPSFSRTWYPWNVSARRFFLSLTHYRSVSKNHSSKTAWQLVFYLSKHSLLPKKRRVREKAKGYRSPESCWNGCHGFFVCRDLDTNL